MEMDIKSFQKRIDEQINESAQKYNLPVDKLKFSTHIFKPDSPKLETVVAVETGWKDNKTKYVWKVRFFYSPRKYSYSSISKLKNDIETYLKQQKLKHY